MDILYSGSIPRFYIVQFQDAIEAWANSDPTQVTGSFGGVTLMRRVWGNVMHIAPHMLIDEWMLHRWDAGFVDATNAEAMRAKL